MSARPSSRKPESNEKFREHGDLDGLQVAQCRAVKELWHQCIPKDEYQAGFKEHDGCNDERDLPKAATPPARALRLDLGLRTLGVLSRARHKSPLDVPAGTKLRNVF